MLRQGPPQAAGPCAWWGRLSPITFKPLLLSTELICCSLLGMSAKSPHGSRRTDSDTGTEALLRPARPRATDVELIMHSVLEPVRAGWSPGIHGRQVSPRAGARLWRDTDYALPCLQPLTASTVLCGARPGVCAQPTVGALGRTPGRPHAAHGLESCTQACSPGFSERRAVHTHGVQHGGLWST